MQSMTFDQMQQHEPPNEDARAAQRFLAAGAQKTEDERQAYAVRELGADYGYPGGFLAYEHPCRGPGGSLAEGGMRDAPQAANSE